MGASLRFGDVAENLSLHCQGERGGAAAGALAEVWFKAVFL